MNITSFTYSGALLNLDDYREKVLRLESVLLGGAQADCPVRNIFAKDVYIREMTIPAGVVLTGAEHKTEHVNIISKGRITVWTEAGMKDLCAPCTFISQPGTKRAGYAHEETVWSTIHANPDNCADMDILVDRLTTSKNCDLLENRNAIEGVKSWLLD